MSANKWRREGRVKLYDYTRAPNPRRVRIFLAEKGITVVMVQLDLFQGAHLTPEALTRNPYRGLPVLELDDGTCIAESVAICRYFEELHPQPPLMGVDAKDKAIVEMWQRRMELALLLPTADAFRQRHEFFKGRILQVPEYAEVQKRNAESRLAWLNE